MTASDERRIPALQLLFRRFPLEEQESRLRDALAASERGSLNLDHLLLAEVEGKCVGSALTMIQSDGVALIWPPVVDRGGDDPREIEDLLMQELCRRMDAASARLGQCLLAMDDDVEAAILTRHGFERVTDMFFLARPITPEDLIEGDLEREGRVLDEQRPCDLNQNPEAPEICDPEDGSQDCQAKKYQQREIRKPKPAISFETYRSENAGRFARLVEATYQGSLDCPHLNGIRSGDEALLSHKLSGEFDPNCWLLYSLEGRDAGLILLNDHSDQSAVELVYLGVAADARGNGLGRAMLKEGFRQAAQRGRVVVFLAVDCQNHFANALYSEFDFTELARRQVMLRQPKALARQ